MYIFDNLWEATMAFKVLEWIEDTLEEKEKVHWQAYQEELKSKVGSQQILKNTIYYYCLDKADSFKLQSRPKSLSKCI